MRPASYNSESIRLAIFLTLSGGLMDAYSYFVRGHVFANAQTGNMLLCGAHLASGEFGAALHYLVPVLSFAAGIALAHTLKLHSKERRLHWRQAALAAEIALLLVVGFVPAEHPMLANCLTSLACGIQVQAFRKLHGYSYASTMCIGNLRSGTQELAHFIHDRERAHLEGALLYYFVIACFIMGAVLGKLLIGPLGLHMIQVSCLLLLVALLVMFAKRRRVVPAEAAA